MKSPLQETRQLLLEQIVASMGLDTEKVEKILVYTRDDSQGDITLETFQLREFYGGMNPAEIADMIASSLLPPDFVSVEHKGSFLNLRLSDIYLAQHALDAVTEQYGYEPIDRLQQPTIVEYSSPNYGKDLHVGHIRSTIVGEAISRLLTAAGVNVVRINYPGDVGVHMGKVLTGIDEWHGGTLPDDAEEAMVIMRQAYTEYEKKVPSGKEGDSLVIDLLPASERQCAYQLRAKAATMSLNIERGEENTISLWKEVCDLSRQAHALLYQQLHVAFDYIQPASTATKSGKAIVQEALKKGVAVQHGEEITVDFGQGQFQKLLAEDGIAVYATLDLGIAHMRYEELQFAKMIYVVGSEQAPYFEKLFDLEQRLGYPYATCCEHLATGHLILSQGKMSSRKGNVTLLKDVLESAVQRAERVVQEKGKLDAEKAKRVAEMLGIGAFIYNILSKDPSSTLTYDEANALRLDGKSAPYAQYAHARACTLLANATIPQTYDASQYKTVEERALIKRIAELPLAVETAARTLRPNVMTEYVYQLATAFNRFYTTQRILNADDVATRDARLVLTDKFRQTMFHALEMICIQAPQEM